MTPGRWTDARGLQYLPKKPRILLTGIGCDGSELRCQLAVVSLDDVPTMITFYEERGCHGITVTVEDHGPVMYVDGMFVKDWRRVYERELVVMYRVSSMDAAGHLWVMD